MFPFCNNTHGYSWRRVLSAVRGRKLTSGMFPFYNNTHICLKCLSFKRGRDVRCEIFTFDTIALQNEAANRPTKTYQVENYQSKYNFSSKISFNLNLYICEVFKFFPTLRTSDFKKASYSCNYSNVRVLYECYRSGPFYRILILILIQIQNRLSQTSGFGSQSGSD